MKKYSVPILMIWLLLSMLAGCGKAPGASEETAAEAKESGKPLHVVTTILPEYDWVLALTQDVAPDALEVTLLVDDGVDLHSFQPAAKDIMDISTCDLFIYVGGESDGWVDDALKGAVNQDMVVISLLEVLGDQAKEEELKEGMDTRGEEDEAEYDEHVWLSLRNTALFCEVITKALAQLDYDNAAIYEKNLSAYQEKLSALDTSYEEAVSAANVKTLLFGDRFPFRYLIDDYGLDYYAAFAGCSAETEASFETVTFLARKVDELSLHSVMVIEGSDHRIAETIIQNTKAKDQTILTLNSMQSVTAQDREAGVTYLGIMEENLSVLREALRSVS